MSRAWMPLYVADYLADTMHLDCMCSGAYMHLLMHYWQRGSLPGDDRQLSFIAKATPEQWNCMKKTLQEFFYDGWKHKRVEEELIKSRVISEQRRSSANKR